MLWRHVLSGLCCLGLLASRAAAEADTLTLRQQLLETEAELQALQLEEKLGAGSKLLEQRRVELADAIPKLNRIADRLETSHRARMEALDALLREANTERTAALKLWRENCQSLLDLQARRADFDEQRDASDARRRLFDLPMVLSLSWGVLVLLAATALALHERRTDLRRWWRSGRSLLLLAALLLPGLAAAETQSEIEEKLHTAQTETATLKERLDRQRVVRLDAWAELLAPAGSEGLSPQGRKLRGWEETAMERMRSLLVANFTARRAVTDADRLLAEAQREREDLSRAALRTRLSGWGYTLLRVGVCLLLCLGPVGLLLWARRGLKRRLAEDARTCPRCLARDKLQVRKSPRQDALYPDPRHVECTSCRHEFRERHRKLARMCFPTVGIRNSGKTRWLGTTYLQVVNAQTPAALMVQAAPSLAEQQEFAEVLRQIVEAEDTAPTVHDVYLPAPLTLHLEDRDSWGEKQALINLFDFSGEVMNRDIDVDLLRRRALLMDGFVLFLDPTQVRGGMLEQQRDALRRFHDDLRDMRKLEPGQRVTTPVAVCLSRLDLILHESPFGPLAGEWLEQMRATASMPASLATLQLRSQLCAEALPFMFQGWDVGRELRERFGGAVQFFPLTSVGLREEQGWDEGSIAGSGFEPFGLFEPLLWLLYRHGYCVL